MIYEKLSIGALLGSEPPPQISVTQLLPELQDVLLEALHLPHLASLQVTLNVLLVDLVDGQLAEVDLGPIEGPFSVLPVCFPQSVGPELSLIEAVLIPLIEDGVEYLLGLDFCGEVLLPNLAGSLLVELFFLLKTGHNHYLLERVVQVLLVIVKGRQLQLFDFLPLRTTFVLFLPKNSPRGGAFLGCCMLAASLSGKGELPIDNLQELGDVNHGILPRHAGQGAEHGQFQLFKGGLHPQVRREEAALLVVEGGQAV